jgi:hypothetical protein
VSAEMAIRYKLSDSWTLKILVVEGREDVTYSLFWNDKEVPTHEAYAPFVDLKRLCDFAQPTVKLET